MFLIRLILWNWSVSHTVGSSLPLILSFILSKLLEVASSLVFVSWLDFMLNINLKAFIIYSFLPSWQMLEGDYLIWSSILLFFMGLFLWGWCIPAFVRNSPLYWSTGELPTSFLLYLAYSYTILQLIILFLFLFCLFSLITFFLLLFFCPFYMDCRFKFRDLLFSCFIMISIIVCYYHQCAFCCDYHRS